MSSSIISGADNPHLKLLKKLQQKKYRDQLRKFVVENPLTIRDGLRQGAQPTEVYVTQSFQNKHGELLDELRDISVVDNHVFAKISSLEQPQGIVAVYSIPEHKLDLAQSVVILLGVGDPGNVGTIMRTAAAFGVHQVAMDLDSADPYNPKTVSAAKEAIFSHAIVRREQAGIGDIHRNLPLFGLDVRGTVTVADVAWKRPCGLVFGSEAHGIPAPLRGHIDTFVSIPMVADSVESLNVGVTAGIILQHYMKVVDRY